MDTNWVGLDELLAMDLDPHEARHLLAHSGHTGHGGRPVVEERIVLEFLEGRRLKEPPTK